MAKDHIKLRGFFKVQITEKGKVVGDSGWCQNTLTNVGFQDYLCALLGNTPGSKQIGYVALGTGTAPNATHATLDGEVGSSTERKAPTVAIVGSKTLRFTATFGSSDSFIAATTNLRNIGLYSNSSGIGLFSGSIYGSSQTATNQDVHTSYEIRFS